MRAFGSKKATAIAVVTVLLGSAACGGSSSDDDVAASAAPEASADGEIDLSALYAGTYEPPPAEAPKVAEQKNVWVVSCGQQSVTCVDIANATVEAAEALGWDTTLCDGKLNPNDWGGCLRQAVAAKADVAFEAGVDCAAIKQPLEEAKAAGVKVINQFAFDCDDPALGGGEPLYAASLIPSSKYPTAQAWWLASGKARADWITNETDGKAKVIMIDVPGLTLVKYMNQGFSEELEAMCPGCSIVETVEGTPAFVDIPPKVGSALAQHPDANAMSVPFDAIFLLGLSQTIASTGRGDELAIVGGEGDAPNMDLIREGKEGAVAGLDLGWIGWGSIDTALRLFAGEPPVAQGIGLQLVDNEHNLPPSGQAYTAPIDYRSAYKKAWGVE